MAYVSRDRHRHFNKSTIVCVLHNPNIEECDLDIKPVVIQRWNLILCVPPSRQSSSKRSYSTVLNHEFCRVLDWQTTVASRDIHGVITREELAYSRDPEGRTWNSAEHPTKPRIAPATNDYLTRRFPPLRQDSLCKHKRSRKNQTKPWLASPAGAVLTRSCVRGTKQQGRWGGYTPSVCAPTQR